MDHASRVSIQLLKCKCTITTLDPGLAFVGKVGLGPFWTLVQVLSYVHVLQLTVSISVSSFRHERIATVGKIYTRMQMQDLIDDFNLINYKTTHDNHGVHG
jgi:hypothetical protein